MIRMYIYSMEHDTERFLGKLRIKKSPVIIKVVRFFGKKLSVMTIGKFTRLLFVRADKRIKDNSFVDLAIDIVRYLFEGNQPFVEGTPEGDTLLKVFRRIRFFVKKIKGSQGEELDLYETLKHSVGNYGIDDYNAVLEFLEKE